MGDKVTIPPITNPTNSSFTAALNSAVTELSDEFDGVMYRDGTQSMQGALDMGSNRIYNLPAPLTDGEPLRRLDIPFALQGSQGVPGIAGDLAKVLTRTELAGLAIPAAGTTRYLAEADREGVFVFSTANLSSFVTADTQQGIYVAPTSAPTGAVGAWVRKFNAPVTDRWFGSTPGAAGDDTVAVQAAINYCATNRYPLLLSNDLTLGALTVPSFSRIIGSTNKTKITTIAGTYTLFNLAGSDIFITSLLIESVSRTGGYEFNIDCGTSVRERITVRDILSFNSHGAITDSGTTGYHITTFFDHCQFRGHRGPGLVWTRCFGFIELAWVVVDYVTVAASNFQGFNITFPAIAGAGGIELRQCDVLGTVGTVLHLAQHGFRVANAGGVWFNACRADSCGGYGFNLDDCFSVTLDAEANLCGGNGFILNKVVIIEGKPSGKGRKGLAGAPAGAIGMTITGDSYNVNFAGGIIRDFTSHGIEKSLATGIITFTGYQSTNNGGYGVVANGSSAFTYQGALVGNVLGNYSLGATFNYILTSMMNNGAPSSAGPGPVNG